MRITHYLQLGIINFFSIENQKKPRRTFLTILTILTILTEDCREDALNIFLFGRNSGVVMIQNIVKRIILHNIAFLEVETSHSTRR
ncbi:MAG: hypothetical protein BWZ06_01971 [Bacteroidetes bacterium ADurb.BinA261]|nr:MAG: hypothetical protein BWZ06_01971 [Bacteroidetes bacterium ADurb.BinA261]